MNTCGVGHNSGKTVPKTLKFMQMQSRDTSEQRATLIKTTSDQCITAIRGTSCISPPNTVMKAIEKISFIVYNICKVYI